MLEKEIKGKVVVKDREFYKSILIGIAASFLVPLFLNTISSNMLAESKEDVYKLFVIAGFCLIASISSKSFIKSVSDNILKEQIKDVQNKVAVVEKEVNVIAEKESEKDTIDAVGEEIFINKIIVDDSDPSDIKVLKALSESEFSFRSIIGISKQTKIDFSETNKIINRLIAENCIDQTVREGGTRFYITTIGREYIDWYNRTTYASILLKYKEKELSK